MKQKRYPQERVSHLHETCIYERWARCWIESRSLDYSCNHQLVYLSVNFVNFRVHLQNLMYTSPSGHILELLAQSNDLPMDPKTAHNLFIYIGIYVCITYVNAHTHTHTHTN